MAIMKKSKRKDLTLEDARQELARTEQELTAEESVRASTGKPKNPGKYREMKRWRATLKMVIAQKQSAKGIG